MKNCKKILFLTLVIGIFMFSGCSDDDDDYADEGILKIFIPLMIPLVFLMQWNKNPLDYLFSLLSAFLSLGKSVQNR